MDSDPGLQLGDHCEYCFMTGKRPSGYCHVEHKTLAVLRRTFSCHRNKKMCFFKADRDAGNGLKSMVQLQDCNTQRVLSMAKKKRRPLKIKILALCDGKMREQIQTALKAVHKRTMTNNKERIAAYILQSPLAYTTVV